jgi:hypothetical protein
MRQVTDDLVPARNNGCWVRQSEQRGYPTWPALRPRGGVAERIRWPGLGAVRGRTFVHTACSERPLRRWLGKGSGPPRLRSAGGNVPFSRWTGPDTLAAAVACL